MLLAYALFSLGSHIGSFWPFIILETFLKFLAMFDSHSYLEECPTEQCVSNLLTGGLCRIIRWQCGFLVTGNTAVFSSSAAQFPSEEACSPLPCCFERGMYSLQLKLLCNRLPLPACGLAIGFQVLRLYGVRGGSQAQFTFVTPSVGTFPALLHQVPVFVCYLFLLSNACCLLLFFLNLAFVQYLLNSFIANLINLN